MIQVCSKSVVSQTLLYMDGNWKITLLIQQNRCNYLIFFIQVGNQTLVIRGLSFIIALFAKGQDNKIRNHTSTLNFQTKRKNVQLPKRSNIIQCNTLQKSVHVPVLFMYTFPILLVYVTCNNTQYEAFSSGMQRVTSGQHVVSTQNLKCMNYTHKKNTVTLYICSMMCDTQWEQGRGNTRGWTKLCTCLVVNSAANAFQCLKLLGKYIVYLFQPHPLAIP